MLRVGHSRALSVGLAVALCVTMVFGGVLPAFASIYELTPDYLTTTTNPNKINDYNSVWREGWGNDPLARFRISIPAPGTTEPSIVGAHYVLARPGTLTSQTVITWSDSYNAIISDPGAWNLTLDMVGESVNPGPFMDTSIVVPGASRAYEGPFHCFFQFYAKDEPFAAKDVFEFGLDMTPPVKVTGLQAVPGYDNPIINSVLTQSRVHLVWDDKLYDTLAGAGYFELFMDGRPYPLAPNSEVSRKVYDLAEHYPGYGMSIPTPREMTIEDLPAGRHTFQVRAVDRATNAGALSDPITLTIDPDFPEINITWPSVNGQVVGVAPTFKATVTDQGGVSSVKFYVDGVLKATDSGAPYEATVDLSAYGQGTTHTLRVLAQDVGGRTNFMEKTFVIDKTKPILTLTSAGPSPFYPRKRDGYKDNFVVKFKSNEAAKATLTLKDSSGKVWRTITKSVPVGASSISWNGRSNTNAMKSGTFKWYLVLSDTAGNKSTTKSGSVSLRYYEIVYSGGGARVIER